MNGSVPSVAATVTAAGAITEGSLFIIGAYSMAMPKTAENERQKPAEYTLNGAISTISKNASDKEESVSAFLKNNGANNMQANIIAARTSDAGKPANAQYKHKNRLTDTALSLALEAGITYIIAADSAETCRPESASVCDTPTVLKSSP